MSELDCGVTAGTTGGAGAAETAEMKAGGAGAAETAEMKAGGAPASGAGRGARRRACLSSEAVNAHGSRILTAGIDWGQYTRNPILLYMHRRAEDSPEQIIGRVEEITAEGGKLFGTLVFDEGEPLAAAAARKWDQGFLNMVSVGVAVLSERKDRSEWAEGQTEPTIERCKLIEVSVVDIGACDDALAVRETSGGTGAECAAPAQYRFVTCASPQEAREARETRETRETREPQAPPAKPRLAQALEELRAKRGAACAAPGFRRQPAPEGADGWTRAGAESLKRMRLHDPDAYKRLFRGHYGFTPEI